MGKSQNIMKLIARVTGYFLHYIRVTSYYVLQELQVTFYMRVTSYYLLRGLRVNFYARVTSYYLLHKF